MVKVSVIMPIYNAERYLTITMDSLLKQTLRDIEIICVDDGSTDSSYNILCEYKKLDSRITILQQKNSYAGVARNYGMTIARGEYMSFLDADDYFKPEMLEEAYICAKRENADVVVFGGRYFSQNIEKSYHVQGLLRENILPLGDGFDKEELLDCLMHFTIGCPWNKLFRRKYIEEIGIKFQPYKRVNDVYFVEVSIALSQKIGLVRKDLIYYRTDNQDSLQGTKKEEPLLFLRVFSDIRKCLEKNGIFEKIKKSYMNLLIAECIYTLEQMPDETGFLHVYNELKGNVLAELEDVGVTEEDFYRKEDYKKCIEIRKLSPVAYLLQRKTTPVVNEKRTDYIFPFEYVTSGSKIVLYAAGNVGTEFYSQLTKTKYCSVLAWVDKNIRCKKINNENIEIQLIDSIDYSLCDFIVIAIEDSDLADRIRCYLRDVFDIADEKIIWRNPIYKRG